MPDRPESPPASPEGAAGDTRSTAADEHPREQLYGPLALTRRTKDDGRELIFFADTRASAEATRESA